MLSTYVVLLLLYVAPPTITSLMTILEFQPSQIAKAESLGITSPFSALFSLPLDDQLKRDFDELPANAGNLRIVFGYFIFSAVLLAGSWIAMVARLRARRGLSE